MKKKYFLIHMESGLEPSIDGPWDTEEDRDKVAKMIHADMDEEDNLFWLTIQSLGDVYVEVDTYSGGFFDDEEN